MTLPTVDIMWHCWQMSECVWATVSVELYWYETTRRKSCPNSNFTIINLTLCSRGCKTELRGERPATLHRIKFSHDTLRYFMSCIFFFKNSCVFMAIKCKQFCNFISVSHINPLNAKLNPICHLLALLGAHHILHVSRIRVNQYFEQRYSNTALNVTSKH